MAKLKKPHLNQSKNLGPETEAPDPDFQTPLFSLEYIQKYYCLSDCTRDEKAAFAMSLLKHANLRWIDLKNMHRHGSGTEKIAHTAIKAPIPQLPFKGDIQFLSLRFDGKKPIVGFRRGRIFYILWFDRAFKLYDHG
jgi:hypothetical protein